MIPEQAVLPSHAIQFTGTSTIVHHGRCTNRNCSTYRAVVRVTWTQPQQPPGFYRLMLDGTGRAIIGRRYTGSDALTLGQLLLPTN